MIIMFNFYPDSEPGENLEDDDGSIVSSWSSFFMLVFFCILHIMVVMVGLIVFFFGEVFGQESMQLTKKKLSKSYLLIERYPLSLHHKSYESSKEKSSSPLLSLLPAMFRFFSFGRDKCKSHNATVCFLIYFYISFFFLLAHLKEFLGFC